MPLIWAAVITAAGSAISGAAKAKSAKEQRETEIQNRVDATKAGQAARLASIASTKGREGDIFGDPVIPEFPKEVSQDLTENIGQIRGQGLPAAREFTQIINQDLSDDTVRFNTERIESFDPNFRDTVRTIGSSANDLAHGRLPTDVFQNVVGNTVGGANMLGTPGGAFPAVLKDLGLTTLDAMDRGQQSAQSLYTNLATSVSPTPNFLGANSLLPFTSLNADQRVTQELAVTRARQAAQIIAAEPDPAARALFLEDYAAGQREAGLLAGTNVPNYSAGVAGEAIGAGVSAYGGSIQTQYNADRQDARYDQYLQSLQTGNQGGSPSTAGATRA